MPLQESTTDQLPLGIAKNSPSRNTGTPDARSATTVKSAVQSISVGTSESPNGTAKNRKHRGKANVRAQGRPSAPAITVGTIATTANWLGRLAAAISPASQHRPSTGSKARTPQDG